MVYNNSDDIGIGTSTPDYKLHIKHDPDIQSNGVKIESFSSTNSNSEIKFAWNGVDKWAIGNSVGHNGDRNFFIYDNEANSGFGATRFFINAAGRVGIGVIPPTSPTFTQYRLYVEGGIMTRDIKVTPTTPFPDYVFEQEYSLMTIANYKKFIKTNKRLPGMPSAVEVKSEEGFEVGEMQIKLLEKIEEQALYIIDLQEQIDEMRSIMEKSSVNGRKRGRL